MNLSLERPLPPEEKDLTSLNRWGQFHSTMIATWPDSNGGLYSFRFVILESGLLPGV